ncbi:MAG: GNAT family N-acetyltransferase [Eubacteriales bacterium]|nr:GNAT family N-acetyltransferase [Eubacteriales bacterium]MDD3214161.1 GNAT family N-acetyltransferase [Eubacteriales bacterium]
MKDQHINGYTLSRKRWKFKLAEVAALLKHTYWAKNRDAKTLRLSMRHAYPYGVFSPDGKLVGFLRVTSDLSTNYYIADVIVAPEERGKGLGLALVRYAVSDAKVCRGKGLLLTSTAAGLYAKVGFYTESNRMMIRDPVKPETAARK